MTGRWSHASHLVPRGGISIPPEFPFTAGITAEEPLRGLRPVEVCVVLEGDLATIAREGPDAVPALIEAAGLPMSRDLARQALELLAGPARVESVPVLVDGLRRPEEEVREASCRALGNLLATERAPSAVVPALLTAHGAGLKRSAWPR